MESERDSLAQSSTAVPRAFCLFIPSMIECVLISRNATRKLTRVASLDDEDEGDIEGGALARIHKWSSEAGSLSPLKPSRSEGVTRASACVVRNAHRYGPSREGSLMHTRRDESVACKLADQEFVYTNSALREPVLRIIIPEDTICH